MGKKYDVTNLINMVKKACNNMDTFYTEEFVNYQGNVANTSIPYTEVIADYLSAHDALFKNIKTIHRQSSYCVGTHLSKYDSTSNRTEEIIAMQIAKLEHIDGIGDIMDYQVPLKNKQSNTAGKIDLLSYDDKNNIVCILELKCPDSKETLLRCVLEGYTYKMVVDGHKLLMDFSAKAPAINKNTKIKVFPLIFAGSLPYDEWQESIQGKRPHISKLMQLLDCKPIGLSPNVPYSVL
ncbi:MAG: hypothetical protein LKI17_01135 [Megasphaera cerevisiae]|jgi:hypothetical protein|nr:hypothetical protein [Megasphaera cerevisiae]